MANNLLFAEGENNMMGKFSTNLHRFPTKTIWKAIWNRRGKQHDKDKTNWNNKLRGKQHDEEIILMLSSDQFHTDLSTKSVEILYTNFSHHVVFPLAFLLQNYLSIFIFCICINCNQIALLMSLQNKVNERWKRAIKSINDWT